MGECRDSGIETSPPEAVRRALSPHDVSRTPGLRSPTRDTKPRAVNNITLPTLRRLRRHIEHCLLTHLLHRTQKSVLSHCPPCLVASRLSAKACAASLHPTLLRLHTAFAHPSSSYSQNTPNNTSWARHCPSLSSTRCVSTLSALAALHWAQPCAHVCGVKTQSVFGAYLVDSTNWNALANLRVC